MKMFVIAYGKTPEVEDAVEEVVVRVAWKMPYVMLNEPLKQRLLRS